MSRKSDRARHTPECTAKLEYMKEHAENKRMEQAAEFSRNMTRFADPKHGGATADFVSKVGANTFEEGAASLEKGIAETRGKIYARFLYIRNSQLQHATEMYKKRTGRSDIPDPPHTTCRSPLCTSTDLPPLQCSRCKSVRYCGRACQIADRKTHKRECRVPINPNNQSTS